jgi:hypothetical protein
LLGVEALEMMLLIPPSPVFCGKRLEVLENREDRFLRRAENCKKVQKNAKARQIATRNE